MKFAAVIVLIFALFGLSMGLKHEDCGQPPAIDGDGVRVCFAFIPSFTYYPEKNACEAFIFGGCGGNQNRFNSQEECEAKCKE